MPRELSALPLPRGTPNTEPRSQAALLPPSTHPQSITSGDGALGRPPARGCWGWLSVRAGRWMWPPWFWSCCGAQTPKNCRVQGCPWGFVHPSSFVLPVCVQPPPGKLLPSSLPLKTDHKQLCVSRVRLQGSVLHCPFALGFVYTLVLEPANSTALLHPSWAPRAGSAGLLKNRRELSMLLGNQRSCLSKRGAGDPQPGAVSWASGLLLPCQALQQQQGPHLFAHGDFHPHTAALQQQPDPTVSKGDVFNLASVLD